MLICGAFFGDLLHVLIFSVALCTPALCKVRFSYGRLFMYKAFVVFLFTPHSGCVLLSFSYGFFFSCMYVFLVFLVAVVVVVVVVVVCVCVCVLSLIHI